MCISKHVSLLLLLAATTAALVSTSPDVLAQQPPSANVKLNFPDQVDLKLLIEYVSQRLDIKILYDEEVSNKKITIKAPNEIPAESLLGFWRNAQKWVLTSAEKKGDILMSHESSIGRLEHSLETNDLAYVAEGP